MSKGSGLSYSQEYYKKNRKRLLAERRKRYLLDPEYRGKTLLRAKARQKTKQMQTVEHAGREEKTYNTLHLALKIGIPKSRVYEWAHSGVLPAPLYHKGKMALYAESQVVLVGSVARQLEAGEITLDDMKLVLKAGWASSFNG